jgi:hypothetical protein
MSSVVSGCRGKIKKNGELVGWCTEISFSLNLQQVPIDVIGEVDTQEIVTVGRSCSGNMSMVRITDRDLASETMIPPGAANTATVIAFAELTLQVEDQVSGRMDGLVVEVVAGRSQTLSLSLRSLSEEQRRALFLAEEALKPALPTVKKPPAPPPSDAPTPPWVETDDPPPIPVPDDEEP